MKYHPQSNIILSPSINPLPLTFNQNIYNCSQLNESSAILFFRLRRHPNAHSCNGLAALPENYHLGKTAVLFHILQSVAQYSQRASPRLVEHRGRVSALSEIVFVSNISQWHQFLYKPTPTRVILFSSSKLTNTSSKFR